MDPKETHVNVMSCTDLAQEIPPFIISHGVINVGLIIYKLYSTERFC